MAFMVWTMLEQILVTNKAKLHGDMNKMQPKTTTCAQLCVKQCKIAPPNLKKVFSIENVIACNAAKLAFP